MQPEPLEKTPASRHNIGHVVLLACLGSGGGGGGGGDIGAVPRGMGPGMWWHRSVDFLQT